MHNNNVQNTYEFGNGNSMLPEDKEKHFKITYCLVRRRPMSVRKKLERKKVIIAGLDYPFIERVSRRVSTVKFPYESKGFIGNNPNDIVKSSNSRYKELWNVVNGNINREESTDRNTYKYVLEAQKQNSSIFPNANGMLVKKKGGSNSSNPGKETPMNSSETTITKSESSSAALPPKKPATTFPKKPATTFPKKPATTSPKKPAITSPKKAATTSPKEAVTTSPKKPVTNSPKKAGPIPKKSDTDLPQKRPFFRRAKGKPGNVQKVEAPEKEKEESAEKQVQKSGAPIGKADQTIDDDLSKDKLYDLLLTVLRCRCHYDCPPASRHNFDVGNCSRTPGLISEMENICCSLERVTQEMKVILGQSHGRPSACYPQPRCRCYEPDFDCFPRNLERLLDREDYLSSLYDMDYMDRLF